MAYLYESTYSSQRGPPEAYHQWDDEAAMRGSGRRAVHWRHLDSGFSLSHGHDESIVRGESSPHRLLAQRRRAEQARSAWDVAERLRMDDPYAAQSTRRKKYVPPQAQTASISSYGKVVEHVAPRPTKRMLSGPANDLQPDFSPRSRTPPASVRRHVDTPGEAVAGDTSRVVNLNVRHDAEEAVKVRGMRHVKPTDAMQPNFVGMRDAKVDRGLRCHYQVPQTLSFEE